MNLLAIIGIGATVLSIVASILAIRGHLNKSKDAEIINPLHLSENSGKFLIVGCHVARRRRNAAYWVAVQPDDWRKHGVWWPQTEPIKFDKDGYGYVRVGLGREGKKGKLDVNKTFTLGLMEVTKDARKIFQDFGQRDHEMSLPTDAKLLHSIDVRRVRE